MEKGYTIYHFDVMCGGRFVCQIAFKHCPLFRIDIAELMEAVYERKPSLRGRKGVEIIETNNIVK